MDFTRLEKFVFEKINETHLPAVSAAVIQGGEVAWSRGFGFRDLERGLAATPQTLYSIGSVTKSFTCMAIMQLAEAGKLSVDDPVEKYLPFDIRPFGETVRIWHLMSHSSGIPGLAYAENVIEGMVGARESWLSIGSYADMLTFMKDSEEWALAKPGERWFYLNEGFVLLSAIVEKVTGVSFKEYLKENIFKPLKMDRTIFDKADFDRDPDAAVPYLTTRDGSRKPSVYPYGLTGDGGIISNVLDMARYANAYIHGGAWDGVRVLKSESIAEMETPRVLTPNQGGTMGDYKYAYGLGRYDNFYGHTLVGHSGSVGVATAYMGFIPDREIGVTVLVNGSGYSPSYMGMYALAMLLGEDPETLPFVQRERTLAELEGTYETYKGTTQYRVRRMGEFLALETSDRYSTTSIPIFPDTMNGPTHNFYSVSNGYRLPVEFRVENGRVGLIYERYYLRKTGKITK